MLGVRRVLAVTVALMVIGAAAASANPDNRSEGRIGPAYSMTPEGRKLEPVGRQTTVGVFPRGGQVTPDGRFFWTVDAGHIANGIDVVDVVTGEVVQKLKMSDASGGIAFAPDGRTAYVSSGPSGKEQDTISRFSVDVHSGQATEGDPIVLPATSGGHGQQAGSKVGWPQGLAVTPDGKTLVVALAMADQAAVVDLTTGASRLVKVGVLPFGVAIDRAATTAYVTNEYDGTVSVVDLASATVTATIPVGGPSNPDGSTDPNRNAHPEGIITDPRRDRAYVAVANRDLVAVVDTSKRAVIRYVSVGRAADLGTEPVALALAPDGRTLYSADAGEDAIAAITLTPRHTPADHAPGDARGLDAFELIGRIPTASYPTGVAITPDGRHLVWVAGKGFGAGPNPNFGEHFGESEDAPDDQTIKNRMIGRVGVMATPNHHQVQSMTRTADRVVLPANTQQAPIDTPIRPNGPIKHVFFFVRENRTYDQVFGSEPRGDGDPGLDLLDDNGVPGPQGGVTPNAHALARMFPLLDHVYANSEVSEDGHKVTAGGYVIDFLERYVNSKNMTDLSKDVVSNPPRDFLMDQAVRQGITFRNYGEDRAGLSVDDGRPTFAQSKAALDPTYQQGRGCSTNPATRATCKIDSGTIGHSAGQDLPRSKFDAFETAFDAQLASGTVPAFNYLTLPNDHTDGTTPGHFTPRAMVADNDLGLGQFVDLISHSPIWGSTAIFVVEDDAQNGADHVDAHRIPALVISPYARHSAVVHTRYDQESVLRTMEIILGRRPLSLYDSLATPMYDAFTSTPDLTPYTAIQPQYPLDAVNPPDAPDAQLSAAMPFDEQDAVPEDISDRILWNSVYGGTRPAPAPGPHASSDEQARSNAAMALYRRGGTTTNVHKQISELLDAIGDPDD